MNYAMGWIRDLPDIRDFTIKHPEVKAFRIPSFAFGDQGELVTELPQCYDIGEHWHLPEIKNQQNLGSCTANAVCFMAEAFSVISGNVCYSEPFSRLFLYKTSRRLMNLPGDNGASLRKTMQALAMFGVPQERFRKYEVDRHWDDEPDAYLYAIAQNYQALKYYRLDPDEFGPDKILASIKLNISHSRPCVCGWSVYKDAVGKVGTDGNVAMPQPNDRMEGGHATCFVGYDDDRPMPGGSKGALKFANSWSKQWGTDGYGWLDYGYVRRMLAVDWWTLMSQEWLDTGIFK